MLEVWRVLPPAQSPKNLHLCSKPLARRALLVFLGQPGDGLSTIFAEPSVIRVSRRKTPGQASPSTQQIGVPNGQIESLRRQRD